MILNIHEVEEQLNNADIYENEEGNKVQTVYLGSILNLTPSGKIYTLFANSNVSRCKKCNGEGEIRNKHGKIKKYKRVMKKLRKIWLITENINLVIKLQRQLDWWNPTQRCPECKGHGSVEIRKDSEWWEELELELEEIDAWHHGSEGDGCDIMISREVSEDDERKQ